MTLGEQTINDFLEALASKEPVPGGGTLAGLITAIATSLGNMVLAYTDGKKKYAEYQSLHNDCNSFFQTARIEAMELATADAEAYARLNALWKLDKDDPKRKDNWDSTLEQAIVVPIHTMELCKRIITTLETMAGTTNNLLVSDLSTSAILAKAASDTAALTAKINLPHIVDETRRKVLALKVDSIAREISNLTTSVHEACMEV
ncbi:MAG: cyclodeaminase/cyclohydrolase family protein [Phycisphaerales bacterium]|nr:cyclodeaminase/cyclohydrolase family protein [Phycisphaerales bacterium]MDP6692810.1 cyclodeaminase/cyclohydrolase family protein [Phycisphaerales bacterium]